MCHPVDGAYAVDVPGVSVHVCPCGEEVVEERGELRPFELRVVDVVKHERLLVDLHHVGVTGHVHNVEAEALARPRVCGHGDDL